MAHVLECKMIVPAPLRETFAFFEDPRNLARITPPWLRFRIASNEGIVMRQGARIDYVIRWAGLRLRWQTLISGYDPPQSFIDEQIRGPYEFWRHLHTFREVEGGTEVCDRVEYVLPFGLLGRIAHRLVVRRQLEEIFAYRSHMLEEHFGTVPVG